MGFRETFSNFFSPAGAVDRQVVFASADHLLNPVGNAARACINRLTSRAVHVKWKDASIPNSPSGSYGRFEFYSELFEQMLIEGFAVAYKKNIGGDLAVAISHGSTYDSTNKVWFLRTSAIHQTFIRAKAKDVLFVTLRPQPGRDFYIPQSPMVEIRDAMLMYEHGRKQQSDYANYATRIGFALKSDKEITNPKTGANLLQALRNHISSAKRNYTPITLPIEMSLENGPNIHAPQKGVIEYAIMEIARFYGVPLQMLQTDAAPTADEERVESRLLVDGVYPLLDRVKEGWTRYTESDVDYDIMSVSRPTLGARAAHLKNLGQIGIFTKNELRGMMDYPALKGPEGDTLASPAGGIDQNENAGKSDTDKA